VLNVKTRLVSFRLSEEEYEKVQRMCASEGSRSLSEFLRSAFSVITRVAPHDEEPLDARLESLSRCVDQLRQDLQALTALAPKTCPFAVQQQPGNGEQGAHRLSADSHLSTPADSAS
jgi:hypothetical protein